MTIFGNDASHFDQPDTRAMFNQGIAFQTHKAGGDSNDVEIGPWWNFVKDFRRTVLLGAYWVLTPGNPAGKAVAFLSRLDATCPGWRDGPFLLQADCERWKNTPEPTISEVNAFCDRLVELAPKLDPVAYVPKWTYGNKVSALRYPVWASSYVTGAGHFRDLYPGDDAKQWNTYGGRGPAILQYTSSATIGGQTTCDANAFRGTLEQLITLTAPGWSTMTQQLTADDIKAIGAEVYAQVGKYFAITKQTDGTPTSTVGNAVWAQGIPDGTLAGTPRSLAYNALKNIGVAALAGATVDPESVASALINAGIGLDVATAIVQQLTPPSAS